METKVKIPFADQNGKIVHISEVENGLACKCNCCYCGAQLIAKNAEENVREAHFAHYDSEDCNKALETSIHKAAKQYLFDTRVIVLPDLIYYDKVYKIKFEKVELEKVINYEGNSIKVDAFCHIDKDRKIIIEFAVTHFSSKRKIQIFNKLKIPTVEVSLYESCNTFNDIKNILESNWYKEWLYYPLIGNAKLNAFIKKFRGEIIELNQKIKRLNDDNEALKQKINFLKSKYESKEEGNLASGFIGIGWGPNLDKGNRINLSIKKEELKDVKTDFYGNVRLVVYNRKKIDKTKSNLVIFVDEGYLKMLEKRMIQIDI